ncbi:MAG: hypothetical protein M0P14_05950, partial [Alkaliphilus sp.]|nr:hypothetical protein [Alkaliphilus sp.]
DHVSKNSFLLLLSSSPPLNLFYLQGILYPSCIIKVKYFTLTESPRADTRVCPYNIIEKTKESDTFEDHGVIQGQTRRSAPTTLSKKLGCLTPSNDHGVRYSGF